MLTLLIFLLLLSVLILVHEFGHFLAARKLGVVTEEFGLGFPPKIKKLFTWKGTEFTLNWLPIGGFVRMKGESPGDSQTTDDRPSTTDHSQGAFYAQSAWKRAIIILAGVAMNIVLAIALFTTVYQVMGIPTETEDVVVEGVAPRSPAFSAGLTSGDVVRQFRVQTFVPSSGRGSSEFRVQSTEQFVEAINDHRGEEVTLSIVRNGETLEITTIPRVESETPEGEGALGVAISNVRFLRYPWWQMPFRSAITGTKEAIGWGVTILAGLRDMIVNLVRFGQVPRDVAGPIGIARLTGKIAQRGWLELFQFAGVLSINLAILNALPIPALDGGRLAFLGIEVIRRKPLNPRIEHKIHLAGYAVLIALIVLVSVRDILTPISQ